MITSAALTTGAGLVTAASLPASEILLKPLTMCSAGVINHGGDSVRASHTIETVP